MIRVSLALSVLTATAIVSAQPNVQARSAIVVDAVTGKVLWSKEPDTLRYPASTTKIMTALLTLEQLSPSDKIVAPARATTVRGSSLHLKPGESLSAFDAVRAMMLRSANDVCFAAAVKIAGSEAAFAEMMNERASAIGASRTRFTNPHGLPDKDHQTTARDLALIAREAMRNEQFREVARTQRAWIERSINQQDRLLVNRNKWLFKDITADGIKTGFTRDAGHTYVGSAVRNGFRVITVVLNSPDWQADHQAMLNWSFQNYKVGLRRRTGETLAVMPVRDGVEQTVPVVSANWTQMLDRAQGESGLRFIWPLQPPKAPIQEGQSLGDLIIRDAEGFEVRVPVVAAASVERRTLLKESLLGASSWYILGGALLCGAWVMRRKSRIA